MKVTRIEMAIDEFDADLDGEFEGSCDDVRLAWLAQQLDGAPAPGNEFDAAWSDR